MITSDIVAREAVKVGKEIGKMPKSVVCQGKLIKLDEILSQEGIEVISSFITINHWC